MIIEERGNTKDGFEYIIGVHKSQGHRMGYIGVYPESPLYAKCYTEDKDDQEEDGEYTGIEYDVHVHGGLTFSGQLDENIIGGYNPHYFGFDCAHLGDGKLTPEEMEDIYLKYYTHKTPSEITVMVNRYKVVYTMLADLSDGNCKTIGFVRNECFHLSSQLKELEADYVDV